MLRTELRNSVLLLFLSFQELYELSQAQHSMPTHVYVTQQDQVFLRFVISSEQFQILFMDFKEILSVNQSF